MFLARNATRRLAFSADVAIRRCCSPHLKLRGDSDCFYSDAAILPAQPDRMTESPIPQSVQDFLRQHLMSFEHLEILLLLHADSQQDWNSRSVSERTQIAPELVDQVLMSLESSELIRRAIRNPSLFRFGPRLPEAMDAIQVLAVLYRDQRAAVMSTMSIQAIERIRSGSMRAFADSFVLKKRNDDG